MKDISNALFDKFFNLLMRLEPENIWMDGDASKAEAKKRETAIVNQWRDLEHLVGRQVSQNEIWDRYATQRIAL